jgi:HSP20 family protein
MANLSIRRGEPRQEAAVWDPLRGMDPRSPFDPLRMMRDLMGIDPFAGLVSPSSAMFAPEIEIKETKDGYVLRADLPGVQMADLEVSVTGNRITVSGKRQEEERREDDRYFAYERSFGSFSRSFVMPEGADLDNIKARLEDGVLELTVPKRAEVQARRVEIGGKEGSKEAAAKAMPAGKTESPSPKKAA